MFTNPQFTFSSTLPAWQTNFLGASSLPSGLTFSSTSLATMYDSTGTLTYRPNNLLTYSNTFSNPAWSPNNLVTPILQNATDPFGNSNSAWTLTDNNSNGEHRIYNQISVNSPSSSYVKSIYAKAGTASYIAISYGLAAQYAVFNVSAGTVSSSTGVTANITSVGNGWYLCSISPTTLLGQEYFVVNMGDTAAHAVPGTVYVGTGSTIQIYGGQYSYTTYQTTPSTYNPTTSTAYYGPRFDNPNAAPAGLLIEGAGTQLAAYTDFASLWYKQVNSITLTLNAATSPDGTSDAAILLPGTSGGNQEIQQVGNYTAQPYTLSVFMKANGYNWGYLWAYDTSDHSAFFDLSNGVVGNTSGSVTATIQNVGNGWYRCTMSWTGAVASTRYFSVGSSPSNGSRNYTGNGTSGSYIYGPQLEATSFSTSYIPNPTSSTASRAADVVTPTTYASNATIWQRKSESAGTTARTYYAPGALPSPFDTGYWYQSMAAYPRALSVAERTPKLIVGAPY